MHKFIIPNWIRANVKVERSILPIGLTKIPLVRDNPNNGL